MTLKQKNIKTTVVWFGVQITAILYFIHPVDLRFTKTDYYYCYCYKLFENKSAGVQIVCFYNRFINYDKYCPVCIYLQHITYNY